MIGESTMTTGLVKYMLDEVKDEGMSLVMGVLEDWHGALESICEIPKLIDDERQAAMLLLRRIEATIKEVIHESENTLTTVTMTWLEKPVERGKRILFTAHRASDDSLIKRVYITEEQANNYSHEAYELLMAESDDTVTFTHDGSIREF